LNQQRFYLSGGVTSIYCLRYAYLINPKTISDDSATS
jgi:hypothetical protein